MPLRDYAEYWAGNIFLSAKGWLVAKIKFGGAYRRLCSDLAVSERYSQAQFRELQNSKLRKLIKHAYENIPYYRDLFKQRGISPNDIGCAEDLKKIPLLTKEILRKNADRLIAKNINRRFLMDGSTTGSTGTPINARRTLYSIAYESAVINRHRQWAGVKMSDRKAAVWGTIWNNTIVKSSAQRPPYWRFNQAENQLLLSYYHLSDRTLPLYFKKLESFRPSYIEGFPSTLNVLASFLKKNGLFSP